MVIEPVAVIGRRASRVAEPVVVAAPAEARAWAWSSDAEPVVVVEPVAVIGRSALIAADPVVVVEPVAVSGWLVAPAGLVVELETFDHSVTRRMTAVPVVVVDPEAVSG